MFLPVSVHFPRDQAIVRRCVVTRDVENTSSCRAAEFRKNLPTWICGQSSGLRHVGVRGDTPIASNSWTVYFMENPKITWMIWGLPQLPRLPAMT